MSQRLERHQSSNQKSEKIEGQDKTMVKRTKWQTTIYKIQQKTKDQATPALYGSKIKKRQKYYRILHVFTLTNENDICRVHII